MIVHLFNCGQVSGPEVLVVSNLSEGLKSVMAQGQIAVVNLEESRLPGSGDSLRRYCEARSVPYFGVVVRSRWDFRAKRILAETLARLNPRLVHAHDVKASYYLSRVARGEYKIVSTHHGVFGRPDLKSKIYEWFYRFKVLTKYDAVCAVSQEDFATLSKVPGLAPKLSFHLNGITRHKLKPAERETERARVQEQWKREQPDRFLDLSPETFCLGMVARLSPEKNHRAALEAMRILKTNAPEMKVKLLLFGAGSSERLLKEYAGSLGLASSMGWMGYREDIQSQYAGLDLVLLLSPAEGLPMTLVEAGWASVPVAATAVGGIPDLLEHGKCGWLLECSDRLPEKLAGLVRELERDRVALRQVGIRFQQRVESSYSGQQWLERLRVIYRTLGVSVEWLGGQP